MNRPEPTLGLRHVALQVHDLEACERFYTALLGLRVEWRPDADNVYLTGGADNLALHRSSRPHAEAALQRLDHIGFMLKRIEQVDAWYVFLKENGAVILKEPRTHRDGARSFYCTDPDGNRIQMIYHPPLAANA